MEQIRKETGFPIIELSTPDNEIRMQEGFPIIEACQVYTEQDALEALEA